MLGVVANATVQVLLLLSMLDTSSPTDLLALAAVLLGAGVVSGLMAGLLGVGGGAVMVPVLYQFFGFLGIDESVRMHVSVATSLAVIIPTSVRSFQAHRSRGAVDMELLRSWVVPVLLGVVVASIAASFISGGALRVIFAVFALSVALKLFFGNESYRLGADIPGGVLRAALGSAIGFLSTLMGIGGGTFNNTLMTLYNRPIHQAVATSSGLGFLIAVPATLGFIWSGWGVETLPPFSLGYVSLLGVICLLPTSVYFAPWGAKLAHRLEKRQLEVAFAVFLTIVAIRFFWTLV